MNNDRDNNLSAIVNLVAEMKRCDENNITTASIAMAYICIDTLASLSRPADKKKCTRCDFIAWADSHLKAHPDQPYQYRGKDVYAARCALVHTYGSETELHKEDPETVKFAYHNGGQHQYSPDVNRGLAIIGSKSFVNDVVHAVDSFLHECQGDDELRERVEERLPDVLKTMPYPD